jgi:hypothetical protein
MSTWAWQRQKIHVVEKPVAAVAAVVIMTVDAEVAAFGAEAEEAAFEPRVELACGSTNSWMLERGVRVLAEVLGENVQV